jgi:tetratricopeptide (TPR) repeat protein
MSLYCWGRWAEVLAALRQSGWRGLRYHLERSDSAPVVAFYEAKCLAGLGRLDEALATVRPYANNPDVPAWMYWCLLANVFDTVRLGDRVIECYEKALDIAPDNQNVLVDFAHFSLDYRRDTARARSLLTELRRYAISDDIRPFLVIVEGLLALEEGRPEQAREILSEAAQLAEAQRHTSPMRGVLIDRIHTYLTLTCAAVGDHAAAEEHFKIAEPRMRALNEVCWLERCQTALGHRT